ncbi:MAG: ATP-binding protein [Fidelibacterota bacterium]
MSRSFRKIIIVSLSGIMAVSFLILFGLSRKALVRLADEQIRIRLKDQIRELYYRLNAEWPGVENQDRLEDFSKAWDGEAHYRVTLLLPDGTVLADSRKNPEEMDNHIDRPEIRAALEREWGFSSRYSYTLRRPLIYGARRVEIHEQPLLIRLALPREGPEAVLNSYSLDYLSVALILLAAALGIGWALHHRLIRAAETIVQGIRRYGREPAAPGLIIPELDEFTGLTTALDQMAHDLDRRIQTVHSQKEELEAVLQGMVEGVVALDDQQQILRMNQAARKLLNFSPDPVESVPLPEVVRNVELLDFLNSEEAETEIRMVAPDRILQVRRTRIENSAPGHLAEILVFHDVTRLRSLEQVRQEFVSNVSHELKTPITSIKGFGETLLDENLSPEARRRFVQTILRQSDRMNALIEDLLELSRLDSDAPEIRDTGETIELPKQLAAIIEDYASRAQTRQIEVILESPETLAIPGNERLLNRAWANLLDNAIKYSPTGGQVRIAVTAGDGRLQITFEDQGPGIPEEDRERVFERFFRVNSGRDREEGGTGLGLAIVKHILRLHGGTISVINRPEGGSCFTVLLPSNDV